MTNANDTDALIAHLDATYGEDDDQWTLDNTNATRHPVSHEMIGEVIATNDYGRVAVHRIVSGRDCRGSLTTTGVLLGMPVTVEDLTAILAA